MARPVKEWIGDTDDQRAPPRVRLRVFDRESGKCHICRQPIIGKKWALDHVTALINGGENRESNLKPVHIACHAEKTAADVAEKAKVAARRKAHLRIVDAPAMQGQQFPKTRKAARRQQVATQKLPIPPRKRPMFAKEATNDA
ncbi:MAG: HNH endonuclease [Aquamicrobium sp.]|uniref:HNH endonuclease n=1 Tax=Aquamicrobium sp. TaxID=1872579 RepID=UPI00349ECF19|nr:HNH endonuclease [Aquamicrobium sp.]